MEKRITLIKLSSVDLFGAGDIHLKLIEKSLSVSIFSRGSIVKVNGKKNDVLICTNVIDQMIDTLINSGSLSLNDVKKILTLSQVDSPKKENLSNDIIYDGKNGKVKTKTIGQDNYLDKIKKNDIVFSVGPAGTGKTFLAVAIAVNALKKKQIEKIILCRPAVEAGENLGFLPGDLKEKIDPYLNPLYDSLRYLLTEKNLANLIENKLIEVAPLAYMRGRTLENAYIILDEAQNATLVQMKMFLTRLGVGSRAIITGDITQIDLKRNQDSGLIQALNILKNIDGVGFAMLEESDIVRHPLVMKIIQAYDKTFSKKKF
ncbi:MAG: PhoH family protein [Candidatus Marinimicrobia bacterium]|nr:PhoH family protein [Candidatus Neomarinimicrobiota bacterium]